MAELNINELLGRVLENPDAIGRVISLMNSPEGKAIGNMLGSMAGGDAPVKDAAEPATFEVKEVLPTKAAPSERDDAACRMALLKALMPYLSENRRDKVEYIMKLLQVMQVVSQAGLLKA